jgi:hypothetical protein
MKDFGEWFNNPVRREPSKPVETNPAPEVFKARGTLESALEALGNVRVEYHVRCQSCGKWYEWPVAIEEYVEGDQNNMCGGSPSCCP